MKKYKLNLSQSFTKTHLSIIEALVSYTAVFLHQTTYSQTKMNNDKLVMVNKALAFN